MPYTVVPRGEEFCVVKKVDPKGKSFGCHPTRPEAIKQMQAIVINEHKSLTEDELKEMGAEIIAQLCLVEDGDECPCEKDLALPEGEFILAEDLDAIAPGWRDDVDLKEGGIPGPENRMANIPPAMLKGLCKKIGKDPGFYTRCVAHKFGGKVTDVKAFCADLHKSCVGKFPGEHPKKKEIDRKEISYTQMSDSVRQAWGAKFNPPTAGGMTSNTWVREVFAAKVIVEKEGKLLSYPYKSEVDGVYEFGQPQEVTVEYLPKLQAWVKEQFDSLSGRLDSLMSQVKEQLQSKHKADGDHMQAAHSDKTKKCSDGVMFYKDRDTGALRWLGVFSNKWRDRDRPPEIIAAAAHKEFSDAVEKGEWLMPELRFWHIPIPIGHADVLAWHDAGFQVAGGTIRKGLEPLVAYMQATENRWAMSHGMPVNEIRRGDPADKTIITRYRSKELTVLPEWAAANELTLNLIGGEEEMAGFSDKDKKRLADSFGEEVAAKVEQLLTTVGEKADAVGLESKERVVVGTPPDEKPPDPATLPPSRQEVVDAVSPLAKAVQAMAKQLDALAGEIKALKGDAEQKEKEAIARTPAASLSELIYASIVKSRPDEARVKGKDKSLAGPKETPVEDKAAVGSLGGAAAIPFLRDLIMPQQKSED